MCPRPARSPPRPWCAQASAHADGTGSVVPAQAGRRARARRARRAAARARARRHRPLHRGAAGRARRDRAAAAGRCPASSRGTPTRHAAGSTASTARRCCGCRRGACRPSGSAAAAVAGRRRRARADPARAAAPAPRPQRSCVTVHDTVPWTHPETLTPRGVALAPDDDRAGHATRVRRIVVPTKAVADELAQHAPGTARVHVIGHGVPAALADPADEDAEPHPRAGCACPTAYVLAVGTLEPRKGIDVLVEAMAAARAPGPAAGGRRPAGLGRRRPAGRRARLPQTAACWARFSDAELAVVLRAGDACWPCRASPRASGCRCWRRWRLGVPVVHSDAPALVEVAGGAGVHGPPRRPGGAGHGAAQRCSRPARTRRPNASPAGRGAGRARSRWEARPPSGTPSGAATTAGSCLSEPSFTRSPVPTRRSPPYALLACRREPSVLIDATAVPADRGGVGRYVDSLVAALDAAGARLTVVCQPRDAALYGTARAALRGSSPPPSPSPPAPPG